MQANLIAMLTLASPALAMEPRASLAPLVDAVAPAVVAIEVVGIVPGRTVRPELRDALGPLFDEPARMVRGEGSGFVISADGLLLTNHHVVDGAQSIKARFTDGTVVDVQLLGSDARTDVALLRLPEDRSWPHVSLGPSADVAVGDAVVAVGNPLGLGTTVTTGIVSGKGRSLGLSVYDAFLQTDAAINQGNSGGPLFAMDGLVIGMNTAVIRYANTVGFAVPSDVIRRVIGDLQAHGAVQRGYLDVVLQPLDPELADVLGRPDNRGALVTEVPPGGSGERAGLVPGDIVLEIDGEAVLDAAALYRGFGHRRPGDVVRLVVWRDERSRTLKVRLGRDPGSDDATGPPVEPAKRVGIGFIVQLIAPGRLQVTDVDPLGAAAGRLEVGDLLLSIDRRPTPGPAEVRTALDRGGDTYLFVVLRGDTQRWIAIPRPDA